jgi:hypothetical protein
MSDQSVEIVVSDRPRTKNISPLDLVRVHDHRGHFDILVIDLAYRFSTLPDYVEIFGICNKKLERFCVSRLNIKEIKPVRNYDVVAGPYSFMANLFRPQLLDVGDFVLYKGMTNFVGIISKIRHKSLYAKVIWVGSPPSDEIEFSILALQKIKRLTLWF